MKFSILLLIYFSILVQANAQSVEEKEAVMKPIKQLFEAMQKSDSAMLRQAFAQHVTMATIDTDKNGKAFIHHESSLGGFLKAVGTPHPEVYHEMIWDEKILIDGNFAQVWTTYAFYRGKKFSHCGVDAFHLSRVDGSWKIFHLADTRRSDGCKIPFAISKQFE